MAIQNGVTTCHDHDKVADMSEAKEAIVEITEDTFERDVLERSRTVPVVVDFWAPWCQPCVMLAPVLHKLAEEYAGRVVVAKANVDQMPASAGRFGVMSIPAVLAFRDGAIANSFVGVLPESVIRNFFEGLLPTEAERLSAVAKELETSDPDAAIVAHRAAIAASGPLDAAPRLALARFLLSLDRQTDAQVIVDELEQRGYLEPEAEALKSELVLKRGGEAAGSLDAARARVQQNPDDFNACFLLAEALAASGAQAEALEIALDLVERDRHGVGENARKLMIAIFNLLPADSPLAAEFRRKLSVVL